MENTGNTILRTLELHERSVRTVFKKCLANETNSNEGFYYSQVLKPDYCGLVSEVVKFSREAVDTYAPTIRYLLGQIKIFHSSEETFDIREGYLRYDGLLWTKDPEVLLMLFSLALSSASISPFVSLKGFTLSYKSPECIPTLSPKDPSFAEWYEAYTEQRSPSCMETVAPKYPSCSEWCEVYRLKLPNLH